MNHYTEVLNHIKTLAESDIFINHVNQGYFNEVDLDKFVVPTLLNIDIQGASFTNGSTITFTVELACLAQRDINNEVNTDTFWKNDNKVDNMNETLFCLNRIWNKLYIDYDKSNITASENPTLEPIYFGTTKILDGWSLNFEIELPNTELNLCQ